MLLSLNTNVKHTHAMHRSPQQQNSAWTSLKSWTSSWLRTQEASPRQAPRTPQEQRSRMLLKNHFMKTAIIHATESHIGNRKTNEDRYAPYCQKQTHTLQTSQSEEIARQKLFQILLPEYFGIFDGHGGHQVAHYAAQNLYKNIMTSPFFPYAMHIAIAHGFIKTDRNFCLTHQNFKDCGATAVIALIFNNMLYVANAGDARAVLCEKRIQRTKYDEPIVTKRLSTDHTGQNPHEKARIEKIPGGKVITDKDSTIFGWPQLSLYFSPRENIIDTRARKDIRIQGILEPSRSLGDQSLKPYITSRPEIKTIKLDGKQEFLILASDGLWDVMTDEAAVQFVSAQMRMYRVTHKTITQNIAQRITHNLVNFALRIYRSYRMEADNITATIVFFK